MRNIFRKIATKISVAAGSAYTFLFAVMIVITWAAVGPIFNFSNTWQLAINTTTTIVTFLMVFLIQNTQNRDSKAMQLKLDELIISTKARDAFVDLEDLTDEELAVIDQEFRRLHDKQTPHPAIHKLHNKIAKEHKRRLSFSDQAHKAVESFLSTNKKTDK